MELAENSSHSQANSLRLDQFMKMSSVVGTGGQAKLLIQSGEVKVNGAVELRRRRKLTAGDVVELNGEKWIVRDVPSAGTPANSVDPR